VVTRVLQQQNRPVYRLDVLFGQHRAMIAGQSADESGSTMLRRVGGGVPDGARRRDVVGEVG
jgi:hypothetical protein